MTGKMQRREFQFELTFKWLGRDIEEEWQVIEPLFVQYWRTASPVLRANSYEHDGCSIAIDVDWTPLARRILRDNKIMAPVRLGHNNDGTWYAKINRPLKLKARCVIEGSNRLAKYDWYPRFFVEYFLFEVFAISNLSCPGAANFYRLTVRGDRSAVAPNQFELSSIYFDDWMVESIGGFTPTAKQLDPRLVAEWLRKVSPRVSQKGSTSTERALFSLHHLCRGDGGIDSVIWVFNALESLLSTRIGENFAALVRRIGLVLELDAKQTANLKRRMRELYDLRSAFVHGGYDVTHPLHSESIDPSLNYHYWRSLEGAKFGFFILGALFQRMIELGRPTLEFEERLLDFTQQ